MVTSTRLAPMLAAAVLVASACGAPSGSTPSAPPTADGTAAIPKGPPTLAELKNMTYRGLESPDGPFDLVNGQWEGEPYDEDGSVRPIVTFADDYRVLGDLNGDGVDEAVVVLAASAGGSGTFESLAVVARNDDGGVDNVATVALGDRVQIRDARIEDGRLVVDALRAGPNDAACCPGELARWEWILSEGRLDEVVSEVTGRLSLATIGGSEWVLRRFGWDVPAPAEPEVTLSLVDGRLAGSSGCNRYSVPVTEGDVPGDITVGATMGTRMACPEPASSVEDRFLAQLGDVIRYGLMLGDLALTYQNDDGTVGVMLFESRPASGEPS